MCIYLHVFPTFFLTFYAKYLILQSGDCKMRCFLKSIACLLHRQAFFVCHVDGDSGASYNLTPLFKTAVWVKLKATL